MPRTPRIHRTLALLVLGFVPAVATSEASPERETRTIRLEHVEAPSALTFLRTIVGTRDVERVDEKTVRIQGPEEDLRLAERVVDLLDRPAEAEPGIQVLPLGADEALLAARLANASAEEAMEAMRGLRMPRVAVAHEPALTLVARGSREQIGAAAERLGKLERARAR